MVAEITHLLVDIDGVVVHGRPGDGLHWKTDLEVDLGISVEGLRTHFFALYWADIVTGRKALRPCLEAALDEFAPEVSAQTLIAYWFSKDAALDDDFLTALGRARKAGLKVFFATNQDHERAKYLWNDLGLRQHADGIMYSAQLGAKKPDEAFFTGVQGFTGVAPEQHLLIDDTAENVVGAKKFGWQAVHWRRGMDLLQAVLPPDLGP